MAAVMPAPAASRVLMSGNEAVARAVWEAGVKVAAAYPGTPSTEMLEVISTYPDIYAEWSVNEKVSLEVAIGAAYAGSRAFCCMKHVGMNVASDALMTLTLTGVVGGLVIAIADEGYRRLGLSGFRLEITSLGDDELRQEREKEQHDLRVDRVRDQSFAKQLPRRIIPCAGRGLCAERAAVTFQRLNAEPDQIQSAADLQCGECP